MSAKESQDNDTVEVSEIVRSQESEDPFNLRSKIITGS